MENLDHLRSSYLSKPLSQRLNDLASNLKQISDSARDTTVSETLPSIMRECEYMINWTAAETQIDFAAELVDMLRFISLWRHAWVDAQINQSLRTLLYLQAKKWSDQVLDYSGLLNP